MRELTSLTDEEAINIGNLAFRYSKNNKPYLSKTWKLYFINDYTGGFDRIIIVDENEPLGSKDKHPFDELLKREEADNVISNLWSKDRRLLWTSADPPHHRVPLYNWVEIDKHFVISKQTIFVMDVNKHLVENTQFDIFSYLLDTDFLFYKQN